MTKVESTQFQFKEPQIIVYLQISHIYKDVKENLKLKKSIIKTMFNSSKKMMIF